MDYVKAFLVGGIICALVQILMEKTKLLPGRIMVLLVCSGAVLSFLGIWIKDTERKSDTTHKRFYKNTLFKQPSLWYD